MKVAFQLTVQTIPVCFFLSSVFCLPLSFFPLFILFSYLVAPFARLVISGGQNVSPLVSLQSLQANILTLEAPLVDFFLYCFARNS